jgi:hypothetical protein
MIGESNVYQGLLFDKEVARILIGRNFKTKNGE